MIGTRGKTVRRDLRTPYIEHGESVSSFLDQRYPHQAPNDFALTPATLDAFIESLLPATKKPTRKRMVSWTNPMPAHGYCEPGGEVIEIIKDAPKLGNSIYINGILVQDPHFGRRKWISYEFPAITSPAECPDVIVRTRHEPFDRTQEHTERFLKASAGMGFLVTKLLMQADEQLILHQDTNNFLNQ